MPKHPVTLKDLAAIKPVGDPQISPDGSHVLYTVKSTDVEKNKYFTHLWLSRVSDGSAVQFTAGEVSDSSPRWSPDGRQIAFVRTRDKKTQVWLAAADGGEPRALTSLPEGSFSELCWSPDGRSLAFAYRPVAAGWTKDAAKKREENGQSKPPRVETRVRYRLDGSGFQDERQHIWVCDVENGQSVQISDGDEDDSAPAWSPDSQTIAFASNRGADPDRNRYRNDILLAPARPSARQKRRTATMLKAHEGSKSALAFSPDGQRIAYIGSEAGDDGWRPKNARLWVIGREGGDSRCLSLELDRTVGDGTLGDLREGAATTPLWSADGSWLYIVVSDAGSSHLYAVDVETARMTPLTEGRVDVAGVTMDSRRDCAALLLGDATHPAEVFVADVQSARDGGTSTTRQLSHVNDAWLKVAQVGKPEEFWLTQPDGARVQGWVIRPPDFKKGKRYPALLYVHGGPHTQYGQTLFHELQWHAARGYVVVYGNPRGSNGREEEFGACIHRDWGKLDYADVMALADHAESLPYVDKGRMAIAGGSYGGYMTNWVVGHTDRFRCGVTDRSICNWISMVATTDVPAPPNGLWPGTPWGDDFTRGWDMSPLKYVENVRTPLLIIHSEGDLRCPISQSEEWFTALRWLGQKPVFVRYPPETSHGMSRGGPIDLRYDRLTRIGEWLDKHLQNGAGASTRRRQGKKEEKGRKPPPSTSAQRVERAAAQGREMPRRRRRTAAKR